MGPEGLHETRRRLFHRQARHATTTQQAVQCRAAHARVDELARHRKQAIQRQPQRLAQFHHERLLAGVQRGLKRVGGVAEVVLCGPRAPLAEGLWGDAKALCLLVVAARRCLGLAADRGGAFGRSCAGGYSCDARPGELGQKANQNLVADQQC
jgi:hypothetical protein